jgi:alpha-glucosidase
MRFYQLCGTNESSEMESTMKRMNDSLVKIGYPQSLVQNKIVIAGQHNEKLWRENFEEAYTWLFNSYVNSIKEEKAVSTIECYPNPVTDILTFRSDGKNIFDTVLIIDMSSRQVKLYQELNTNSIDVSDLQAGTYIIKCINKDFIREGKFIKK